MIIYNGKNSKIDFDLYIASREQPPAQRKVITEAVPYMSGLWDFSYHDGDIDEYEAVKIKYTFDVIADSKQELKALRKLLVAWIHSRGENKLIDTEISESAYYTVYHAQASWSEEGLQGLLTAEFTCYPFMKTEYKIITLTLTEAEQTINIINEGERRISPIITLTGAAKISNGAQSLALSAGTYTDNVTLVTGSNVFTVSGSGTFTIKYWAEVL